jgi:putative photosynthetic complex assembly protein 2
MAQHLAPVAFALFAWWFSTGAILHVVGLPPRAARWSMLGATLVLGGALYGLALTRNDAGAAGAYVAFTCVLLVWGWQETAFLLGFVTGPRTAPCPQGCHGWRRAGYAIQTIAYHELALVVLAIAVFAVTADGANAVGRSTFAVLWTMRQSAKLNLFLGVRNVGEEFLPERLRYLASYFRRRAVNPLFPLAVGASGIVAAILWQRAVDAEPGSSAAIGTALVAALLSLAILEHVFMVMPLSAVALWRWGLRSRRASAPVAPEAVGQGLRP